MSDHMLTSIDPLIVLNGNVVLPNEVVQAAVAVKDGLIEAVLSDAADIEEWLRIHPKATILDAQQRYVLPGLIDIHCDAIEKEVQPRPNTLFPLNMALLEFERKLPVHGITTMYHSLSLGVGLSLRGDHLLTGMVEHIHGYRSRRSMIRNRIHLRFEMSHLAGMPIVERYLKEKTIDYLSFMDHSPGQGQYREPGSFERYVMKNQGVNADEVRIIVEELIERRQQVNREHLLRLSSLAAANGIAIASHDDDSVKQVEESIELGVSVCEFPINLETAIHAVSKGLRVCVGAPNVVRGVSHDKNMRAVDAIHAGAADILCSDYHPSSMLAAVFKLFDEGTAALPAAVRMATLHPAEALGADSELGSIESGKAADLIVVGRYDNLPWVTSAIVGGKPVYAAAVRY
ncbi:alpha-D-ribose 1-methylphosphonate 5-triphosphate diphosphatase [Paenibacillus alkaliterrae]|uniref:alpha-D-ribose 1-methylphosphonate 5-triphosphate diphosphatase n=1 Tax=Paenibacillus alkaliterrae TaxID=320909 RepID=UPI001F47F056|nr:alpha-D-ribose 1-methylphosphonate 5-triphosphate diphosphatase [Paenibacillus alkaliterrae]MCF2941273.1 alpha-D-ribose 1-methylphosphonate 5-triphosphate diphosphatase [Paenibacillus alkaliterrae]